MDRRFDVEITSHSLNYAGRSAKFVSVLDVTERTLAERALGAAEEKYRSIFEHSSDGIFQNTPEGRFLSANPALARMLGFDSPEELIRELRDIEREGYADLRCAISLRKRWRRMASSPASNMKSVVKMAPRFVAEMRESFAMPTGVFFITKAASRTSPSESGRKRNARSSLKSCKA